MKRGYAAFVVLIGAVLAGMLLASVEPVCGNGFVEGRFPDTSYE